MARLFLIFLTLSLFISCSKKVPIYEASKKLDPYKIYDEAYEAFENNEFFLAHKKFTEAELNFESPESAAKSSIMASYSLYAINFYSQAEENLERFIKTYPGDKNVIYSHYLLAVVYYEQITDEKRFKAFIESKSK